MIPPRLLPHQVTVVHPAASTGGYGDNSLDYGAGATRVSVPARLEQVQGREVSTARDAQVADWSLFSNYLSISGVDRVEFNGVIFEVVGPVESAATGRGAAHHTHARLRTVAG